MISAVTWPPLSVVATLLTRIVPSESNALMPTINVAFIIRLDPERIIAAPMRIPRRGNFVVESSGKLVARPRRSRVEGATENSGFRSEIFLSPSEGLRLLGLPENASLHSSHSKRVQGRCSQTSRAIARRAVATPPGMQLFNHWLTIAIHDTARVCVCSRRA